MEEYAMSAMSQLCVNMTLNLSRFHVGYWHKQGAALCPVPPFDSLCNCNIILKFIFDL